MSPDVPAPPPPPALSSAGPKTLRIVLVVIAALVSLVALGGLSALAYGLGNVRLVAETQALPAGMRSLTIDTGDVPVAVNLITDVNATEPHIDVRMLTSTDETQVTVANDDAGSRITLSDNNSGSDTVSRFLRLYRNGEIKVVLPPSVARGLSVTVNQRAGLLIADTDLDKLVARTDDGVVTLGGSARLIDVDVRHGYIATSTRIAVTESFRATTENGNISVEFSSAPRTTEAIAGGQVTVGLPGPGPYRVRAQAERRGGGTTVTVPVTTDPSAPGVTARSKRGNVMVTELR